MQNNIKTNRKEDHVNTAERARRRNVFKLCLQIILSQWEGREMPHINQFEI